MNTYYRHGDVLFKRIESLPENLKLLDTKIIAFGEATGHNHKFQNDQTIIYENEAKQKFVSLSTTDTLKHQEHKDMEMPVGNYSITIEREYDAFAEMAKQVQD